jgi:hypothetical protein
MNNNYLLSKWSSPSEIIVLIGDICEFGFELNTVQQLVPPFSKYEFDVDYQARLNGICAENHIGQAIELKTSLACSLYTIEGIDENTTRQIVRDCIAFGGFYIRKNNAVSPYELFKNHAYISQKELSTYKPFIWKRSDMPFVPQSPYRKVLPTLSAYLIAASTFCASIVVSSFPVLVKTGGATTNEDLKNVLWSPRSIIELRSPDDSAYWLSSEGKIQAVMLATLTKFESILEKEVQLDQLKSFATRANESATGAKTHADIAIAEIDSLMYQLLDFLLASGYKVKLVAESLGTLNAEVNPNVTGT